MKKNYINPSLTIVEMNFEAPIASSPNKVTSSGFTIEAGSMKGGDGGDATKGHNDYDEDASGWGNGLW